MQPNSKLELSQVLSGKLRNMAHVYRYSSIPTLRRENVAEHSFYCALIAYLIATDLRDNNPDIEELANLRVGILLERALLHDIDEAITGDFLRKVKYSIPGLKEMLNKVAVDSLVQVSSDVGVDLKTRWLECKDPSLEGNILALSDFLCVVSYVLEEVRSGNTHIRPVLGEVKGYLQKFYENETSGRYLGKYIAAAIVMLV